MTSLFPLSKVIFDWFFCPSTFEHQRCIQTHVNVLHLVFILSLLHMTFLFVGHSLDFGYKRMWMLKKLSSKIVLNSFVSDNNAVMDFSNVLFILPATPFRSRVLRSAHLVFPQLAFKFLWRIFPLLSVLKIFYFFCTKSVWASFLHKLYFEFQYSWDERSSQNWLQLQNEVIVI